LLSMLSESKGDQPAVIVGRSLINHSTETSYDLINLT
jgi:hypothetical protein